MDSDSSGASNSQPPEALYIVAWAVQEYKQLLQNLWHRLVRLNHSLAFMREMESIPWDLLFGPDGYTFWSFTYQAHGDIAVLLIHGMLNDAAEDHLSFNRLKNRLMQEWVQPEKRADLQNRLKACRPTAELSASLEKIERLRHEHIAHTLIPEIDPSRQPLRASLSWSELDAIYGFLKAYLNTLGLGVSYALAWPGSGYNPGVGSVFNRTDLSETLDAFLETSQFIRWPETRPQAWRVKRQRLTPETLDQFNSVRSRLGLPAA